MSTNGTTRVIDRIPAAGSRPVGEVTGIRVGSSDDQPDIPLGEMAYPIGGNPWSILGLEDPSIMQTDSEVPLTELRKMTQRDGQARCLLNILSWPLRAAKRSVDPDADGEQEADFIRDMLERPPHRGGMSTPMSYVLAAHGLAFRDAFKVFEKVVDVRTDVPGHEGKFMQVLRKLKPLPSDSIRFRYDDYGGFAGVVQEIYWRGRKREIPLDPEKCLLYTVGKEESPLEGESLFLPAYYHYDKKHRLYYIAHLAAQVGAVPLRVGSLPGGSKATRRNFMDALKQLGLAGSMVVPAGAVVETHQNQTILAELISMIEHHDISMSKSILAHFLDVGTEGKGGLGTATTTSELGDLFVVALEAHLSDIAEGFNSFVIPYFIDKNFGTGRYPTFRFEPFSDEQKEAITTAFSTMLGKEAAVPELWFQVQKRTAEALGLEDIDWDDLEQLFVEEQKRKRELAVLTDQAMAEQIKNPPDPAPAGPPKPGAKAVAGAPLALPKPGRPVGLQEDPEAARAAIERAIALAEATAARRSVTDAFGQQVLVGDRVTLVDSEFDSDAIFTVTEVVGGSLVLRRVIGDGETYDTSPIAKAAGEVSLLG